tara:strand:- start:1893 stop:2093 length:201 start_codon:yes stop_codon:yes gene_type:complete
MKYTVIIVVTDTWNVHIEADNEAEAEDLALDLAQLEITTVNDKEKAQHLKYVDSEWHTTVYDSTVE